MRVNKKTLLFEDLTEDARRELLVWAEDVVLQGKIAYPDPPWVTEWMKVAGYDERQRLLTISTSLPQRILLSLVYAKE